jgi:hypothetical protein
LSAFRIQPYCTAQINVTVIQYCYKRIIEQYAAAAAARTRVGLLLLLLRSRCAVALLRCCAPMLMPRCCHYRCALLLWLLLREATHGWGAQLRHAVAVQGYETTGDVSVASKHRRAAGLKRGGRVLRHTLSWMPALRVDR